MITIEKTIKHIEKVFDVYEDKYSLGEDFNEQHEARDMAIKAIKQEPCEDCISRQAVINHICEAKECYKDDCKGRIYKRCYDLQWIYDLPPVTPYKTERRNGGVKE